MITKDEVLRYHMLETRAIRDIDEQLLTYCGDRQIVVTVNDYPNDLINKLLPQYRACGWDIVPKMVRRQSGDWCAGDDLVKIWRVN